MDPYRKLLDSKNRLSIDYLIKRRAQKIRHYTGTGLPKLIEHRTRRNRGDKMAISMDNTEAMMGHFGREARLEKDSMN